MSRFLSSADVLSRVCISKTQLYRLIKAGEFPKPIPLGPRKVAFLESEVEEWMAQRLHARQLGEGESSRHDRAMRAVEARK